MAWAITSWTSRASSGSSDASPNCEGDMKALGSFVIAMALCAGPAFAQDRMPQSPADKLTEAHKKAAAEFLVERKQEVFGPIAPLSRSPQLMINAERMGTYLRFGNSLPRDVSEFAILLVSRRWTQL